MTSTERHVTFFRAANYPRNNGALTTDPDHKSNSPISFLGRNGECGEWGFSVVPARDAEPMLE